MATPSERLCANLTATLRRRAQIDAALGEFAAATAAARCLSPAPTTGGRITEAARPHLAAALDGLGCDADLADAVRAFAPSVDWYRILEGAAVDANLVEGMLVGRPELPADANLRLGLFLIAPHVHYPLHQHRAREVYFVLSGDLKIQHGRYQQPFVLAAPDYAITPSNRLHALRTGERPCLVAYVWTGELTAPAWWWAEDACGWHRTRWDRAEDGRWFRLATEPVTAEMLSEAGEI